MAALDAGLNQSGCSHLQDFLRETLHFWHKIIKDRLARYSSRNHCIIILSSIYELHPPLLFSPSDFEKVLTQLHWPIISPPTQSLTPTANGQEINSQLELLVTQLVALQTSYPSHLCSLISVITFIIFTTQINPADIGDPGRFTSGHQQVRVFSYPVKYRHHGTNIHGFQRGYPSPVFAFSNFPLPVMTSYPRGLWPLVKV